MVAEDWKTAQNVVFDAESHVEFVFNAAPEQLFFQRLPLEYEANISSFKEKVEAAAPSSFDDLVQFPPIECLEFEVHNYHEFQVPPMSHYAPVEAEKPLRPGCEHEYALRSMRGDPDTLEKEPEELSVAMPSSFSKPFSFPKENLILPHPTLRCYVDYKGHSEVDPEYFLAPFERHRPEPKDEIMLRNERSVAGQTRLLIKNDVNVVTHDLPGYQGFRAIEPMPMFMGDIPLVRDQAFEAIPELMNDANPLDCPSEEDSDDATDFNLNVK